MRHCKCGTKLYGASKYCAPCGNKKNKVRNALYREAWANYFKDVLGPPECDCCGKKLVYIGPKRSPKLVHWDHREKGYSGSPKRPARWLRMHSPFKEKNQALWRLFDFGRTCMRCNLELGKPENRIKRLKQQLEYSVGPACKKHLSAEVAETGDGLP
jgi:hypothetical protein